MSHLTDQTQPRMRRPRTATPLLRAGIVIAACGSVGAGWSAAAASELDPRIELASLQAADRLEEALEAVEALIATSPSSVNTQGAHYLKGHLLEKLRRNAEAGDAFTQVISAESALGPQAQLRVAELQEQMGLAAPAAALAAELLLASSSRTVSDGALSVLTRTLEAGGDCRLLDRLKSLRLRKAERRQLELMFARCELKGPDPERTRRSAGRARLERLISEDHRDLVGLLAADLLFPLVDLESASPTLVRNLAKTFHHHRRFDLSVPLQARQLPQPLTPVRSNAAFDQHFQMGRGHFWQGQFLRAADVYGQLAERSVRAEDKSRALYHRSRALELAGLWTEAKPSYIATHNANPSGDLAGAGLLGSLRLRLRSGEEAIALSNYSDLSRSSQLRNERRLAALFLASSFLENSRVNNVRQWLNDAESRAPSAITQYWRGRLAELEAEPETAVEHYVSALEIDYFHPVAQLGLERLERPDLRSVALAEGERLAQEGTRLNAAWILLGSQHEAGLAAKRELETQLTKRSRRGQLAPTTAVAVEDWPLWRQTPQSAEELLLSFGIWSRSGSAWERAFPASQPNLAFTAALELQRSGRTQEGLRIVESLAGSIPRSTPPRLVPRAFRRALYPYPYRFLIEQAARRFKVDPLLMAALMREESRFNPTAASNAAARGLTQFIIPTAEKYAREIGLDDLTPDDLDRPEIAVSLAAAYLKDLTLQFDGRPERILAAYNAGEAQSKLWGLHCYGNGAAEFITKVSFSETRAYVIKVMRSYAQYRDLYADDRL